VLIYIATDICHDHQFSSASLLGNVFKPRLVKSNLNDGKHATFILETAATFKLKELKPGSVILPEEVCIYSTSVLPNALFHMHKK